MNESQPSSQVEPQLEKEETANEEEVEGTLQQN